MTGRPLSLGEYRARSLARKDAKVGLRVRGLDARTDAPHGTIVSLHTQQRPNDYAKVRWDNGSTANHRVDQLEPADALPVAR